MVEFGLKLSDNKVSKWGDKYLDYERLKLLLKKAKAAMKVCDVPLLLHVVFSACVGVVNSSDPDCVFA